MPGTVLRCDKWQSPVVVIATCRKEVEAQLELSLHPNIVRFMGASYAFAKEGSDDDEAPGRRGRKDDFLQEVCHVINPSSPMLKSNHYVTYSIIDPSSTLNPKSTIALPVGIYYYKGSFLKP